MPAQDMAAEKRVHKDSLDSHLPLISVIVVAYNCEKTILALMKSLITHSYPKFEIIIIDDNTDQTGRIIDEVKCASAQKIRVISLSCRTPAGKKRNLGVECSKGKIICFTNSDCVASHQCLTRLTKPIREGIAPCAQGHDYLDSTGSLYSRAKEDMLRVYGGIDTRNLAIQKEALLSLGGFHNRSGTFGQKTTIRRG